MSRSLPAILSLPPTLWLVLICLAIPLSARAEPDDRAIADGVMSVAAFGGAMTDNHREDVLTPSELEFRDPGLAGQYTTILNSLFTLSYD